MKEIAFFLLSELGKAVTEKAIKEAVKKAFELLGREKVGKGR